MNANGAMSAMSAMSEFEFEDDYPCIGVCTPDPETGLCLGCGRPLRESEDGSREMPRPSIAFAAEPTASASEKSSA